MLLPVASSEQTNVINALITDNNVIIDSVAGSGKTTCNLHIAKYFNEYNILLLTYNSRLKLETREKVKLLKINNIETHSYHSFCVKYYSNLCFTDSEIIKILDDNTIPIKYFKYDIIILDETQDMNPIFFKLVCKIFRENNNINPKICILGDERQCIFDFNNADKRFITFAEKIFTFNTFKWKHLKLTTSFRISFEMSEFINNCMLNKTIITSNKVSHIKPRYIFWEPYHKFNRAFHEIKYYLKIGYKPSDIFVLAPSVRSLKSPIRKIENKIKTDKETKDVPVFVPITDDIELDKDIIENKLVFSTFHQTKGLERKVVLIIGFDNSYFEYYKKNYNTYQCPNELYVAATRSLEHLSLFHGIGKDWLDFLKTDELEKYCEIILPSYFIKLSIDFNKRNDIHNLISVTDLLRHIPSEIIDKCWKYIKVETKREKDKQINIPTKIKKYGSELNLYEEVSEITGTAIPEYFEYLLTNRISIFENIIKECGYEHQIIQKYETINNENFKNNFSIENLNASKILQLANIWNTYKNKFLFKLCQINDYTWLSEENLTLCVERLRTLNINENNLKFETKHNINILNVPIVGYIDCVNNDNIYEFKCVKELKKEHYLQLALYKYMYEMSNPNTKDVKKYYLYNILSDELILLISSHTDVFQIIKILIENKYKKNVEIIDDVFLLNISNIKNSAH